MDARLRGSHRVANALLGGGANIVVPYGDTIGENPLVWQLLDRADPDQIRVYTGSVADLEDLDPDLYEASRRQQEARLAELPGDHRIYLEEWRELHLGEWPIPAAFREEVTHRAAPLLLPGFEDWIFTNGASPLQGGIRRRLRTSCA